MMKKAFSLSLSILISIFTLSLFSMGGTPPRAPKRKIPVGEYVGVDDQGPALKEQRVRAPDAENVNTVLMSFLRRLGFTEDQITSYFDSLKKADAESLVKQLSKMSLLDDSEGGLLDKDKVLGSLDEIFKKYIRFGFLANLDKVLRTDAVGVESNSVGHADDHPRVLPLSRKPSAVRSLVSPMVPGSPARGIMKPFPMKSPQVPHAKANLESDSIVEIDFNISIEVAMERLIFALLVAPSECVDEDLRNHVMRFYEFDEKTRTVTKKTKEDFAGFELQDDDSGLLNKSRDLKLIGHDIELYFNGTLNKDNAMLEPSYKVDFFKALYSSDLIQLIHFDLEKTDRLSALVRHLVFNIHCYKAALLDPYLVNQTEFFYNEIIRLSFQADQQIATAIVGFNAAAAGEKKEEIKLRLQKAYERILDYKHLMGIHHDEFDVDVISFAYKNLLILAKKIELAIGLLQNPKLDFEKIVFIKDDHIYQPSIEKATAPNAAGGHFYLPKVGKIPFPVYKALDLNDEARKAKPLFVYGSTELANNESSGVKLVEWLIREKQSTPGSEAYKVSGIFPKCYRDNFLAYVAKLHNEIKKPVSAEVYANPTNTPESSVFLIKHPKLLKPGCEGDGFMYVNLFKHIDKIDINFGGPAEHTVYVTTIHSVFPLIIFDEENIQADFRFVRKLNKKELDIKVVDKQISEINAQVIALCVSIVSDSGLSKKAKKKFQNLGEIDVNAVLLDKFIWSKEQTTKLNILTQQKDELIAKRAAIMAKDVEYEEKTLNHEEILKQIRVLKEPEAYARVGVKQECQLVEVMPYVYVRHFTDVANIAVGAAAMDILPATKTPVNDGGRQAVVTPVGREPSPSDDMLMEQ